MQSASDIFFGSLKAAKETNFMSVSFGMEKSNRRWKFMTMIGCCNTPRPAVGLRLERTPSQPIAQ